jgi:hypothetical protein
MCLHPFEQRDGLLLPPLGLEGLCEPDRVLSPHPLREPTRRSSDRLSKRCDGELVLSSTVLSHSLLEDALVFLDGGGLEDLGPGNSSVEYRPTHRHLVLGVRRTRRRAQSVARISWQRVELGELLEELAVGVLLHPRDPRPAPD